MRSQLAIALGSIGIRIAGRGQDRLARYTRLQALFAECEAFQLGEGVAVRGTVDEGVLEEVLLGGGVEDGGCGMVVVMLLVDGIVVVVVLGGSRRSVGVVFELPGIFALVVQEFGVVVALVEIFEHGGEDFGNFFGEGDAFCLRFEELAALDGGEEGGGGEDGFVGGEEAGGGANGEGDYGGGEVAVEGLVVVSSGS